MKEIQLTKGLVAIVDDEDFEELSRHKWCGHHGYAYRAVPHPDFPNKRILQPMHRYLMGLAYGDKREVDHRDCNRLNNSRSNLRVCSHSENQKNKSAYKNNTSGYKGVTWDRTKKRWNAQIRLNSKHINLGRFKNPEDAHFAYCEASRKLHGEFSRLN